MAKHSFSVSALIDAPAAKVYGIIADYREGHPSILPKPFFGSIQIERGGTGAGTVISFQELDDEAIAAADLWEGIKATGGSRHKMRL